MVIEYLTSSDDFHHPDDGRKQCIRCFQRLERSEFYAQTKHSTGLHSYCKPCFREYRIELRERKRHGDFRRLLSKASRSKKDSTAVQWAEQVIKRFGGKKRAAEYVHKALITACESDRPPAVVIEFFGLLARIQRYDAEQRNKMKKARPAVETMTDTEIASELRKIARGRT